MKKLCAQVLMLGVVSSVACNKPASTDDANAPTAAPAPTPVAPVQPSADEERASRERAEKQGALAFATMEDTYLNDAKGQWAKSAKASSTFGEQDGQPADSSLAANAAGAPDTRNWTNNRQDMGFDTLEAQFEKPVMASEIRVVVVDGVEAINKLEVRDVAGAWTTVWSGLADIARDERGPRTWFAKTFEPTKTNVSMVRVTFANQVARGYKVVDAVQLVGQ